MSDTVQEIKDKLSIVDVVGGYVKLTKAGKYHKGLCPFHNEKTPSFMVSPDRDFYHCFGCGKGGDIFSFVQDIENLDFKGALRLLAEKAGVTIEYEAPEKTDEKEKLFHALKDAEDFYIETLKSKKEVKEYLEKRGLKEETVEKFRVGYAPNEWRALSEHLEKKGHALNVIEDAGLSKRPESDEEKKEGESKKAYDRLRGRVIFPIRDISGRTVGFSGRIFEDDPKHPQAKYINSPETKVFHKSRILYGLDMAKEGIRKYGFAMLVEGQVDLLMAHQSGFTNTVALSGTSFTEAHAALIKRHSDNLLIAFDGDTAGIAAAGRAAALALKAGINTKIARLPEGVDPADVMEKDSSEFKGIVREAKHVVDFYLRHLRDAGYDARTFKLEASRMVLPFVNMIQNAIDQEHFIKRVADALEVSEDAIKEELGKIKKTGKVEVKEDVGTTKLNGATDPFLSRSDTIVRLLSGMFIVFNERKDEERHARIHEALLGSLGKEQLTALTQDTQNKRAAIIEADLYLSEYEDLNALDSVLDELIDDFKKESARKKYREKTQELKKLEVSGSDAEVKELTEEVAELAKEL